MSIPFIDLKAQFRVVEDEVRSAIDRVLEHGQYIMGPEVGELEAKLSEFAQVKHTISCSSGTDALLMPLMAYGVGPGDAVFTTPFTFIATAEVICLLGATPVFVDIDPHSFNMDPAALAEVIDRTKREKKLTPRGIIAVDLFGLAADYDVIEDIAKTHDLFLIADAAQSFGGTYKDRRVGSLGDVASTSFFPAKPLGCYGDGGAVFTDDDELADTMRSIRIHGKGDNKYDNVRVGINGRLDTLQAAVLLAKLRIFPDELLARDRVATRYTDGLADFVETPKVSNQCASAWAQYCVLSERRDAIQSALKDAGIPSVVYYPKPLHAQGAFADLGYKLDDFAISAKVSERIFGLPMHPYLEPEAQDQVIAVVAQAADGR